MSWYIAKLVFSIESKDINQSVEQFDEQLCMIDARDEQEAFFKARMQGVKNEDEFEGPNNKQVFWKFIDVTYLKEVNQFKDGMEIYSCIQEKDSQENYEKYVRLQAKRIEENFEKNLITHSI